MIGLSLKELYELSNEKIVFNLPHVQILSSTEFGLTRSYAFDSRHNIYDDNLIKDYAEKSSELSSV